jgi:hypothetical protein
MLTLLIVEEGFLVYLSYQLWCSESLDSYERFRTIRNINIEMSMLDGTDRKFACPTHEIGTTLNIILSRCSLISKKLGAVVRFCCCQRFQQ